MRIERAAPVDYPDIETLLAEAGLPLDGAQDAFQTGVVARDDHRLVGAAAVEVWGDSALLRSVVVAPDQRGSGVGQALVAAAEEIASAAGAWTVYLLTETAADWFPRLGYTPIARADISGAVIESVEFTTACSETAVAMCRQLPDLHEMAGSGTDGPDGPGFDAWGVNQRTAGDPSSDG
jgi:amino-acid N-acetyltransferase